MASGERTTYLLIPGYVHDGGDDDGRVDDLSSTSVAAGYQKGGIQTWTIARGPTVVSPFLPGEERLP